MASRAVAAYLILASAAQVVSTFVGANSEFRMPTPVLFNCLHLAINTVCAHAYDLASRLGHPKRKERPADGTNRISGRDLVAIFVNAGAVYLDIFIIQRVEPHVVLGARAILCLVIWTPIATRAGTAISHGLGWAAWVTVGCLWILGSFQFWQTAYDTLDIVSTILVAGVRLAWMALLYPPRRPISRRTPLRQRIIVHLDISLAIHLVGLYLSDDIPVCHENEFFSRFFTEWTFWLETSIMALCGLLNLVLMWTMVDKAPLPLAYAASVAKNWVVVPLLFKTFLLKTVKVNPDDPCS